MNKYWSGAHTKHRLMYHIVWIPKYRKRILKGKIAERIKELLLQCAEINGWEVDELNVQPDHVHLLIQLKPSKSISHCLNQVRKSWKFKPLCWKKS